MEPDQWQFRDFEIATNEINDVQPERRALRRMALDTAQYAHEEVFWLVLRWGGITPANASMLQGKDEGEIKTFECLRKGRLDRAEAYEKFNGIEANGLGPSFFTKLIYFASSEEKRGYIMDQWTSKSVNRLFPARPKIKMDGNYPSRRNPKEGFEEFCNRVEAVARKLDIDPDLAEYNLFQWLRKKKRVGCTSETEQ